MEKELASSLRFLGLAPKEIKFFLASFTLGPASITEINKIAKLERSTAYLIATELLEKGFLIEDYKEYKKTLTALDPKQLITLLRSRERSLRRQEDTLEENLPQLQALYQASEIKPKVRVFQGNKGLLSVWQDILSSKSEILLFTNQATESSFFSPHLHMKFISDRIQKKLSMRVLTVNNTEGQALLLTDKESLRQTKVLPVETTFSAETYIYDSKVAILDYNKDIIGIITESESISTSQKALFDMMWKLL